MKIDPRAISRQIRDVALAASTASLSASKANGVSDEYCGGDRVRAIELADRFAIEGPPRVGDFVEWDDAMSGIQRGIVTAADAHYTVVAPLRSPTRAVSILKRKYRVIARSPWSLDDLEQTR